MWLHYWTVELLTCPVFTRFTRIWKSRTKSNNESRRGAAWIAQLKRGLQGTNLNTSGVIFFFKVITQFLRPVSPPELHSFTSLVCISVLSSWSQLFCFTCVHPLKSSNNGSDMILLFWVQRHNTPCHNTSWGHLMLQSEPVSSCIMPLKSDFYLFIYLIKLLKIFLSLCCCLVILWYCYK